LKFCSATCRFYLREHDAGDSDPILPGIPKDQDESMGEEGPHEPEPEIDISEDPFSTYETDHPDEKWDSMIRNIQVRQPKNPSEEEQRSKVRWLLRMLEAEPEEPSDDQVREATEWLQEIEALIPNHEEFVAANFSHHYPAWHELLKGVRQKSAEAVLTWIKSGFKPRFAGTGEAK
jgi:hypothetical protein